MAHKGGLQKKITDLLQTGQAQNCIKYQCEQCGHNTMQSELLSSEHKWSSKGATKIY